MRVAEKKANASFSLDAHDKKKETTKKKNRH